MKNLLSWKDIRPHLVALLGFVLLSLLYVSPVIEGKRLQMHDIVQSKASSQELEAYHEKTGEWAQWTNSMFSGMPAFMVGGDYPLSISTKIGRAVYHLLPIPASIFLLSLLSAYLLLYVLTASARLAFTGAVAFTFATFNLISIEAGHLSKVMAIGYAPGVIAGVVLAFRKDWLTGAAVTALFMSLELYANHIQITYYLGLALVVYVIIEALVLLKSGQSVRMLKTGGGLLFGILVAVGSHTTRLWNAFDYQKETIRGKSELSPLTPPSAPVKQDGLDKDYAFNWSYGIGETLNMVIPNAYGGSSSNNKLTDRSETYKVLTSRGVDASNARNFVSALPVPLYWGDQPGTGGPAYAGAIVFFLFVLGLVLVKGRFKWWLAGFVVLYIIWAWGKNFASLNYLFFDYFPMFNKFRAVTMTMALAQLFMVVLGIVALNDVVRRKWTPAQLQQPFLISLGLTAGVLLLMALVPTLFFSFRGPYDAQFVDSLTQNVQDRTFAEEIVGAIVRDRAGVFRMDAFRSLFFILVTALLLWLWVKEKIRPTLFYGSLALLMIADLFGVDKRYLNNEDFISRQAAEVAFQPSAADTEILQDTDPHFRVFDLTRSPFQSAEASYFHKSIGGYHGAKLRRYQELFERQIARPNANPGILDMLNTRYIMTADQQGNPTVQHNTGALGNAWFVHSYEIVPDADAEMAALDSLKPALKAVVDQRFSEQLEGLVLQFDSSNTIRLVSYKPDELVYESNAGTEQLAIFSEIYYNVRDEWKVTIDGAPAPLMRADYTLRAVRMPAGKHTVRFKFEPVSVAAGNKIDLVSSVLLLALLLGALVQEARRKNHV